MVGEEKNAVNGDNKEETQEKRKKRRNKERRGAPRGSACTRGEDLTV